MFSIKEQVCFHMIFATYKVKRKWAAGKSATSVVLHNIVKFELF